MLGKTGTLATRPGVTWLVPLAPTEPSDARPCPLPVTALIWLGMVWRPLAVCPLLASVQARFGLEAGDSPGGRGVSGGHYNPTVHTHREHKNQRNNIKCRILGIFFVEVLKYYGQMDIN